METEVLVPVRNEETKFHTPPPPPPPPPSYSADDDDDDSDREMTEEEDRLYWDSIKKSDGFDVVNIPGVCLYGQRHLVDIDYRYEYHAENSRLAVEEYNRRFKDLNGELEFVKVLKAVGRAAAGFVWYLTFEAKALAAAAAAADDGGCKIKTYQSEVFNGIGKTTVESFRLKPPEDEQGSGKHGGAWFWNNNNKG